MKNAADSDGGAISALPVARYGKRYPVKVELAPPVFVGETLN